MAIVIHNLTRSFHSPDGSIVPIIKISSLDFQDGQHVALMGSSGSGKTTLLHLIAGILTPDGGSITFQLQSKSTDITQLSEAHRDAFRGRHIGYVFQTSLLIPAFTALENVLLGMSFTGRNDRPWAAHLLEEVGLKDRLAFKPAKLSVGQQQRVAVARALANRPNVVLADEPTGSLDASNARQVLELMRKLASEVRATLVMVTHDRELGSQFPRIIELGSVNEASASHTTRSVA